MINDVLLTEYQLPDAYCILALTNRDLYLADSNSDGAETTSSDFVFGLANRPEGCGTLSFFRYQASQMPSKLSPRAGFTSETTGEAEDRTTWLKYSCSILAHELAHMFGLW